MNTLAGYETESFEEPIRTALQTYSDISGGDVVFDVDKATKLTLTPDKPNSARSTTPVEHLGENIGNLHVIAFDRNDGTGDESRYKVSDSMDVGFYTREPKVMPRDKSAFHSEAHLTIASFFPEHIATKPYMFTGNLDLIGFTGRNRLGMIATLGQELGDFTSITIGDMDAEPTATLTTGFDDERGERFGDPHAVYNASQMLQICGFLAITNEQAAEHAQALRKLGAVRPKQHR